MRILYLELPLKSIQSPSNLAAAICKGVSLVPQKTAVADPHWMYPCLGHRGRREGECGGSTGSLVWGANFLAIFTAFSSVDVGNSFWLKMTGAYQKLAAGNSNILLFSSRKMGEMIQFLRSYCSGWVGSPTQLEKNNAKEAVLALWPWNCGWLWLQNVWLWL